MKESLNLLIYRDLYDKIKSRFYKPNEQLPTESELEKIYRVSKAPVRQALGKLQTDGLIFRKAGKGTFVSPQIQKERTSFLGGFGAHFSRHSNHISYQLVDLKEVLPIEKVKEGLRLSDHESVVLISRLRLVDKKPIFLLNHYVPNLPYTLFESAGTIENMRSFLQTQGIEMTYITEKIQAVSVDDYLKEYFQLPIGTPLLKIYRTSLNSQFIPVVYEEYYVFSETWTYDIQFNAENPSLI